METEPLQIKSDSAAGSSNKMYMNVYTAITDDNHNGFLSTIQMNYPGPTFHLSGCTGRELFPVTPPAELEKIWTFTKTATNFKVECNGLELLDVVFAQSTTKAVCEKLWSQDVEWINFYMDSVADQYRSLPGIRNPYNYSPNHL